MNILRAKHLDKDGLFSIFNISNSKENTIRMYFTPKQFEELSELDKTKFINEKRNYDYLLSIGLNPQKPLFMRLVKGGFPRRSKESNLRSNEDDDEVTCPPKKKRTQEKRLLVRFAQKPKTRPNLRKGNVNLDAQRRLKLKIGVRIEGYKCQVCCTMFSSRDFLISHEKSHKPVNEVKQQECPQCSYSCDRKQDMERHILVHTGERPHECDVCGKRFNRIHHLTTHRYTHSNECPYKCEKCGSAFKILSNLRRHELLHKKILPFLCKICGRKFTRKEHVKDHMFTHSQIPQPIKCKHCRYRTSKICNLRKHVLTKHKKRKYPYSCSNCSKRFTALEFLKSHIEQYYCCPKLEVYIKKIENII